jgi:A/G-specific adenine glycosylase
LPGDVESLRALPGVGAYTAGAIASIAFGLDEPVVDGNVARVLARLGAMEAPADSVEGRRRLWDLARHLLPPGRAGAFNEALMDLGATVCHPREPHCEACPLGPFCRARAAGRQDKLPVRKRSAPVPHHVVVAGVIWRDGRVLIDRRPAEGLLGGLWEFPGGKVEPGETLDAALRREVREEVDLDVEVGEELAVVRHAYSHFRITLHAFSCRWRGRRARPLGCDAVKWVRPGSLGRYAFPAANQPILRRITPGRRT